MEIVLAFGKEDDRHECESDSHDACNIQFFIEYQNSDQDSCKQAQNRP